MASTHDRVRKTHVFFAEDLNSFLETAERYREAQCWERQAFFPRPGRIRRCGA